MRIFFIAVLLLPAFLAASGSFALATSNEADTLKAANHFRLGVDHWQTGQRDRAIWEWQESIRLNPDLSEAHYNLGIALRDNKIINHRKNCLTEDDTLECLASVEHLSRQPPTNLSRSLRALNESVRLNPNHPNAHRMKGLIEGQLERYENAAHSFEDHTKKNPEDTEAHFLLCASHRATGNLKRARVSCKKAVELNPDYKEAWHLLGSLELELRQSHEALAAFVQVVRLDPQSAPAWFNLGLAHRLGDRTQDEIDAYLHGLDLAPDDAAFHLNLAAAYHRQEKGSLAIDHARKARDLYAGQNDWRQAARASRNLDYFLDQYWGLQHSSKLF